MRGSPGVEDHIVAAKVAMDDARVAAVGGQVLAEPVDQRVHLRQAAGVAVGEILLRPARDLAFDEGGGLAIIAKPDRGGIERVQLGDGRVHRVEVGGALRRRQAGEGRFPDDPPLDQVHDEEGRADDARRPRTGRGSAARGSPSGPSALITRASRSTACAPGKQRARRLAAQDEGAAVGGVEAVGRVGLAALELADA